MKMGEERYKLMKKVAKIFEQKIPKSKKLASKIDEVLAHPFDKEAQKKDAGLKEQKKNEDDESSSKTDTPKSPAAEESKTESEKQVPVAEPE